MAIHCKLSRILGEKRIKVAELTRMTKVSETTLHNMYHDRVTKENYSVLNKLCKTLDCVVSDLLVYEPDDEDSKNRGENSGS